jgi:hypothetical protein
VPAATPSLFASLYKWAKRQDENFCTEGLIYLLRLLITESPDRARPLIQVLSGGLIGQSSDTLPATQVVGQVVSNQKRPDVQIACGRKLGWVEVKVDSPVGEGQLANYRKELRKRNCESRLVLLWRGGDPLPDNNRPDLYVRWIEVSECLRRLTQSAQPTTPRFDLVAQDYLAFLESRQLAMSPVSPNVARSIQDVGSLLRTIGELLTQTKLQAPAARRRTTLNPDSPYLGHPVCVDGTVIGWIGVHLHEPQWLFFTTEGADKSLKLNLGMARQLAYDGRGDMSGDKNWTLSIDLTSADGMLSKDPAGQIDWLRENLLDPALQAVQQLFDFPHPATK